MSNKVTQDQINALQTRVQLHIAPADPDNGKTTTFVHGYIDGKFFVGSGMSACVDPANFDESLGIQYATQDLMTKLSPKLWELEGYALWKKLNPGNTLLERVTAERDDRQLELAKLQKFLSTDRPAYMSDYSWNLLHEQATIMEDFVAILNSRLYDLTNPAPIAPDSSTGTSGT